MTIKKEREAYSLISDRICLQYDVTTILAIILLAQTVHETNPAKIVASTGFRLYQTLISPSQGDVCNFSPSCSHFAKSSIEEYGIVWGSLMASDRLQRCNPWALGLLDKYYSGITGHKINDPIHNNYIFGDIRKRNVEAHHLHLPQHRLLFPEP
jgi:putative component of membrane protein insertase Oxa1/YidC/SpoIIIJ protein YidD